MSSLVYERENCDVAEEEVEDDILLSVFEQRFEGKIIVNYWQAFITHLVVK